MNKIGKWKTFLFLYKIFATEINLWYDKVIHKECARDSPVDHTATCVYGKVLKAETMGL